MILGFQSSRPFQTGSSITWDANQFEYICCSEISVVTLVEICISNPQQESITLYSIKCDLFAGLAKIYKGKQVVDDPSFERKMLHFIDLR